MLRERLEELIDYMSEGELIELWNEYCGEVCSDDKIYYMDELDDFFYGSSASEILDRLDDSFSTSDEYFQDTYYGVASFDCANDVIETSEIIDYIIENENSLYNDDIKELLKGVDEYEDEPDAP